MDIINALNKTTELPPQTPVEVVRGMTVRRTKGGIVVGRLHYSCIPERDPEINPQWKIQERRKYTSEAAWQREQEIVDSAEGGELVFADTLVTHWDKIIISDPSWRPDPSWRCEAGFDHGRTNATVLERCYIDYEGVIYFCGEYYTPGKEIWEHAPVIKRPSGAILRIFRSCLFRVREEMVPLACAPFAGMRRIGGPRPGSVPRQCF